MTWIEPEDVGTLLQTDLSEDPWIAGTITHTVELIEGEIGAQDPDDLPTGLAAQAAQIAARLWRAGKAANSNPAGNQQDTLGPHSFTAGGLTAGFGLTQREKDDLDKFKTNSALWVQPTNRGDALETPGELVADTSGGDPIMWIAEDDREVTS